MDEKQKEEVTSRAVPKVVYQLHYFFLSKNVQIKVNFTSSSQKKL